MKLLQKFAKAINDLWEGWEPTAAHKVRIPGDLIYKVLGIPENTIYCEHLYYLRLAGVDFSSEVILLEVDRLKTRCRLPDGRIRDFCGPGVLSAFPDYISMKTLKGPARFREIHRTEARPFRK